jgi:hypothetical protein
LPFDSNAGDDQVSNVEQEEVKRTDFSLTLAVMLQLVDCLRQSVVFFLFFPLVHTFDCDRMQVFQMLRHKVSKDCLFISCIRALSLKKHDSNDCPTEWSGDFECRFRENAEESVAIVEDI